MGVTPGTFVGVRSSDMRPGNLNDWLACGPNDVISLSAEFFTVIRLGFSGFGCSFCLLGGRGSGDFTRGSGNLGAVGETQGSEGSTPVHMKQRIAKCC